LREDARERPMSDLPAMVTPGVVPQGLIHVRASEWAWKDHYVSGWYYHSAWRDHDGDEIGRGMVEMVGWCPWPEPAKGETDGQA